MVVKNEVRREERWAAKSVPAPAISATESVGTGPGVSEEKHLFFNLKQICRLFQNLDINSHVLQKLLLKSVFL